MSTERVFLVAAVDAILIAEPTVESRLIRDDEVRDVAQLIVDAYIAMPGHAQTIIEAQAIMDDLLAQQMGEPRRDAWLGVWEGYGRPVSAILCTTWRGMPYIAHVLTAPAVRGRGYGSSLVREAAQVFKKSGATHVGVTLVRESPYSDLFRELGFVEMFSTVDA